MRLALAAALSATVSALPVRASDCPQPVDVPRRLRQPATEGSAAQPKKSPEDQQIEFEADTLEARRDGEMLLKGDVVISQGNRQLKTRDAVYDTQTQSFKVDGGVEYSDPNLKVTGAGAHVEPDGGATFEGAQFELPAINARGSAERINATAEGRLQLDSVRYTTCPVGQEDWLLRASDIDINQQSGIGLGRGVRLDFKGVPILYTPFISFPVGTERKSGFLFPTIGTSSSSGYSLSVPWYWNIAPNYDATLTPTYYSKRGARLDTRIPLPRGLRREARCWPSTCRTTRSSAQSGACCASRTGPIFTDHLRLDLDAANASDSQWFEDFGLGPGRHQHHVT